MRFSFLHVLLFHIFKENVFFKNSRSFLTTSNTQTTGWTTRPLTAVPCSVGHPPCRSCLVRSEGLFPSHREAAPPVITCSDGAKKLHQKLHFDKKKKLNLLFIYYSCIFSKTLCSNSLKCGLCQVFEHELQTSTVTDFIPLILT